MLAFNVTKPYHAKPITIMIQIQIIGNLGKDAETIMLNDQPVTKLIVATNRKTVGTGGEIQEQTTWWNCTANHVTDKLKEYLKRGKQVYIQGDLRTRIYTSGNGQPSISLDVRVTKIELC